MDTRRASGKNRGHELKFYSYLSFRGRRSWRKHLQLTKGAMLVFLVYCLKASLMEQGHRQTESFLKAPVAFRSTRITLKIRSPGFLRTGLEPKRPWAAWSGMRRALKSEGSKCESALGEWFWASWWISFSFSFLRGVCVCLWVSVSGSPTS